MSEGLEAVMHTTVDEAPSDDDLIQELSEKIDAVESTEAEDKESAAEAARAARAEMANKVAELDEPEVDVKGVRNEDPITEEAVAGEKAGKVAAPDSALLKNLRDLVQGEPEPEQAPIDPHLQQLAAISQRMAELQEQQITGVSPADKQAQQNTPQAIAQRALQAAEEAKQEAARYRDEIAERERERRLELLEQQIVDYVTSKADAYPLVNDGNQKLVSAAMLQSIQEGSPLSEDEALAHVEGKLTEYVKKSAARLGWTPPGAQSNDGNSGKAKSTAESTLTKEAVGSPAPSRTRKSWDEMSDEERDNALIGLL